MIVSSLASLNSQMPTSRHLWLVSISIFCANHSSHLSFRFNLGHTSYLGMEVKTGTVRTRDSSVALPSVSLCGSYPFGPLVLFGTLFFVMGSLADICTVSWASLCLCLVRSSKGFCVPTPRCRNQLPSFICSVSCVCIALKLDTLEGGVWGTKGNKSLLSHFVPGTQLVSFWNCI